MAYECQREPLTASEVDRLVSACETPTERLVVWTLLDTGLRVSELCDLTRKHIVRQRNQLRLKRPGASTSTRSYSRVVPMSTRVQELLLQHFALQKTFPVKKRRAQDIVKAMADRAQITKEVSPRVLRTTFAAMALQRGISLPAVQQIMGHDRIYTTARYSKCTGTHIREEFERK